MLVKLTGEQVSRHWIETIKPAIANSLPDYVNIGVNTLNNVLTHILSGVLDCYVIMDKDEVLGICTTTVTVDPITKSRAYLIYSVQNIRGEEFPDELWATCLLHVMKVAKSQGCGLVYCYTNNEKIVKRAEQSGGTFNQQLITFPCAD